MTLYSSYSDFLSKPRPNTFHDNIPKKSRWPVSLRMASEMGPWRAERSRICTLSDCKCHEGLVALSKKAVLNVSVSSQSRNIAKYCTLWRRNYLTSPCPRNGSLLRELDLGEIWYLIFHQPPNSWHQAISRWPLHTKPPFYGGVWSPMVPVIHTCFICYLCFCSFPWCCTCFPTAPT